MIDLIEHLDDIKVSITIECPKCGGKGCYRTDPSVEKSCENCKNSPGVSYPLEISLVDFMVLLDVYNKRNPVALSHKLRETYVSKRLEI